MNYCQASVRIKIALRHFYLSALLGIATILFSIITANSQGYSNKGNDFWITYPAHINTTSSAMGIYITSDVAAKGMIYVGSKYSIPFTVSPNSVTRKFIGPNGAGDAPNSTVYLSQVDGIASNAAIRVVSDNPVVVYAHIIFSHRSGASLILPSNVWGKQYIIPSYNNIGSSSSGDYGYGTITVVAKDSNTIIQITPTINSRSGKRSANLPYQITLVNPGDVYQVEFQQDQDISGTKVESISSSSGGCKPIAVFSSTTWSAFGCSGSNSGDNLYQQLFPVGSWGKNFLTSPAAGRAKDIFRMFVKDTATTVKYMENGVTTVFPKSALVNNSFYEYETGNPIYIQADKPISAIQYFKTQKCDNGIIGDPEMISLNPLEQTINNITVFSAHQDWVPAGQSDVTNCYLNIIINTAATGSFTINSAKPNGKFISIPGTSYSYLQEDVSQLSAQNPVQKLSADSNFTAIAYGFGDVESYGYNAGTNIKDFSQYLTIRNPYPTSFNNNTSCDKNPFHIGIVLPYQPLTMVWNFNNNTNISPNSTITNNAPVADSIFISNGVTQYYYKLLGTYLVNSTNSIPLKVSVNNPSTDGCGGLQDIDYIINITAAPSTNFNVQSTGCIKDSVYFTNTSIDNGTNITQYTWEYNGVKTSSVYNPATVYNTAGNYPVKLSNVNALGCYSDTTKIVSISTVPVAAFNQIKPACKNTVVQFADQSTIAAGVLAHWYWDYGNGNKDSLTKSSTVSQLYDSVRIDTVRLTVVSSSGCKSSTYKVVPINQLPVADFTTPEICLNDAFAQFNNQSTISDGTTSLIGYAWQFGDQNSSSINNTSNALNGIHKYSAVGNYNVILKAISNNGCMDSIQHSFTVNGSTPNANFSIQNQGNLCSNDSLKLQNTSTVDFGNITQLEIYWDYINKPTTKFIDSTPTSNKTYKFLYYNFHQPLSQQFTIHVIAYSGISCISTKDTTITVYSSPEISATVSPKLTACLGDTFTLKGSATGLTASITNNWLWVFGDGTTATSQNYLKQYKDSGTYTIIFTGTTTDGCMDTALNTVTIYPVPHIITSDPLNVLEGNSVTLAPTYGGQPLTYLWTPASYLNNANIAEPLCTPKTDTLYTITATNKYNCSLSDSVYVSVLLMPLIPNVFTPNGDGIHDKWHIEFLNKYPYCTVDVFDRNGQSVFHEYTYSEEWDGSHNGKPIPMGTYYYVIKPNSGREPITGSITIIR